ncbi:MAG: YbaY family lipoprotein [Polaromonas sp.]
MTRRMMKMAVLGALGLLSACATGPASQPAASSIAAVPVAPAASSGVRVSGTISYLQRVALPPDSDVIVQLRDVSRVDAKADILAEQRFTTRSQVPLPFELMVEPAKIDPRMRYAVAARIERGGKLMFINDKLYPVLTQGHGSRVEMVLHMVARP